MNPEPQTAGISGQDGVIPTPGPAAAAGPAVARLRRIDPEARLRGALHGTKIASRRRREAADTEDDFDWPCIFLLRAQGDSLQAIADEMTRDGIFTHKGRHRWHATQVRRIIERVLDRGALIAADLEEDLASLRSVYRRERGGEIPALPPDDDEAGDDFADLFHPGLAT